MRGTVAIGEQPGIIHFSELSRYLSLKIAEDLEVLGLPSRAQETISVGTYAGDPRLFILRRITLDRLEAETPRYAKTFLRRALKRAFAAITTPMVLGIGGYYYYLEHSFYVWRKPSTVEGLQCDYLAIYAGDPQLNALGFPHVVRTTDIPVTALPRQSRPGVGLSPSIRLQPDVNGRLFEALTPQWKSIVSGWQEIR